MSATVRRGAPLHHSWSCKQKETTIISCPDSSTWLIRAYTDHSWFDAHKLVKYFSSLHESLKVFCRLSLAGSCLNNSTHADKAKRAHSKMLAYQKCPSKWSQCQKLLKVNVLWNPEFQKHARWLAPLCWQAMNDTFLFHHSVFHKLTSLDQQAYPWLCMREPNSSMNTHTHKTAWERRKVWYKHCHHAVTWYKEITQLLILTELKSTQLLNLMGLKLLLCL